MVAGGIGVGAASDLAFSAIKGEQEAPPVYYLNGAEDAATTVNDDSWNLLKISQITDNFSENTENVTGLDQGEMALKREESPHHAYFMKLKAAFVMLLLVIILYVLFRVVNSIRMCFARRRASVDLSDIPRLQVTGPNRGWWRPRPRASPSAPSCEGSPCPSYSSAVTAPVLSDKAFALLEELAKSREDKLARVLDSVPGRVQPVPPSPRSLPVQDMEEVMRALSAPAPSPRPVQPDQPAIPQPQPLPQPPPEEPIAQPPSARAAIAEAEIAAEAARANPTAASLARMRRILHQ